MNIDTIDIHIQRFLKCIFYSLLQLSDDLGDLDTVGDNDINIYLDAVLFILNDDTFGIVFFFHS